MNHIYLIRLVLLKRPSFQSQKYGMPNYCHNFVIVMVIASDYIYYGRLKLNTTEQTALCKIDNVYNCTGRQSVIKNRYVRMQTDFAIVLSLILCNSYLCAELYSN